MQCGECDRTRSGDKVAYIFVVDPRLPFASSFSRFFGHWAIMPWRTNLLQSQKEYFKQLGSDHISRCMDGWTVHHELIQLLVAIA